MSRGGITSGCAWESGFARVCPTHGVFASVPEGAQFRDALTAPGFTSASRGRGTRPRMAPGRIGRVVARPREARAAISRSHGSRPTPH
jgi:hypothetical protein